MAGKRQWLLTTKQENNFQNLRRQIDKVFDFRTHHQGKRGTARYRAGCYKFAEHLAKEYGSTNFKNIRDKHLSSYVKASVEAGISASTIKTDLAAVRKLHDLYSNTRYKLADAKQMNAQFGIEKRVLIGIDRAWSSEEINLAVMRAQAMERKDVEWAIQITAQTGTRIEEVTALTRTQLRDALKTGYLGLRVTKGGIPRDVPLERSARSLFKQILNSTHHEHIFKNHGKAHHQSMKSIQNWIANNRPYFQLSHQDDREYKRTLGIDQEKKNLTFHGLRHAYARQEYYKRIKQGMNPLAARKQVAELLGHGRDAVTKVYLGGK